MVSVHGTSTAYRRVMRRRAFLTAVGITGYGGLGWLVGACSEATQPNRLGNPTPGPTGSTPTTQRPTPTDDDEYVPGSPDGGGPVIESTNLPNATWEARAKALESGAVYTEAAPGPWAGKERSHVPTLIADTVLTNRVTVLVNHVMQKSGGLAYPEAGPVVPDAGAIDAAADGSDDAADGAPDVVVAPPMDAGPTVLPEHFVAWIYVKTDTGMVAGLIELKSTDPAPPSVTFVLPPGTKSVTAYEFCNLHGLWASKPLEIKA